MKLRGVDYVAIILASGLMAMMSLVMLAVILNSGDFPGQRREEKSRLSEPETRIMEPWPGEKKEE